MTFQRRLLLPLLRNSIYEIFHQSQNRTHARTLLRPVQGQLHDERVRQQILEAYLGPPKAEHDFLRRLVQPERALRVGGLFVCR